MQEALFEIDAVLTKRCSRCHIRKPLAAFNRRSTAPDGRQWACRECNAKYHADNKERHNALIHARSRRLQQRNAEFVLDYLRSKRCVDCGEDDPVVLDFDHLRDKQRNISWLVWRPASIDAIIAEIEKCEVVCANCHRRRTAERAQTYRWRYTRGSHADEGEWGWRGSNPRASA